MNDSTVWKYSLPFRYGTTYSIDMPKGAEVLCAKAQGDTVCVWVRVYLDASNINRLVKHRFCCCLTGGPVPSFARYIGTVLLHEGSFVVHVFDMGEGES